MLSDAPISKENLDQYLKELTKEYRKCGGKHTEAEIILFGGAAVLINYGFRQTTYDMDVIICAASSMKEAINHVGDMFNLPNGWMNDNIKETASYTPKILQYTEHYRKYYTVEFRTVKGEYLVAMKMRAGREYKNDRSDIIGVLWEQEKKGDPLSIERIKKAVEDLYGCYDVISEDVRDFVDRAIQNGEYEELYASVREIEKENENIVLDYQEEKPDVINRDNINKVLEALRKRKGNNQ